MGITKKSTEEILSGASLRKRYGPHAIDVLGARIQEIPVYNGRLPSRYAMRGPLPSIDEYQEALRSKYTYPLVKVVDLAFEIVERLTNQLKGQNCGPAYSNPNVGRLREFIHALRFVRSASENRPPVPDEIREIPVFCPPRQQNTSRHAQSVDVAEILALVDEKVVNFLNTNSVGPELSQTVAKFRISLQEISKIREISYPRTWG